MTMSYTASDAAFVRRQREAREGSLDLVKCSDGLWRTAIERDVFEANMDNQQRRMRPGELQKLPI